MTHTHAKVQLEWKRTDIHTSTARRTEAIALPPVLTRSLTRSKSVTMVMNE